MWDLISNIASIVTCVAFILYLVGHVWAVWKNGHTRHEKVTVVPFASQEDIEDEDAFLEIDEIGSQFTLQSDYGIKSLKVYKYDQNEDETLNLASKKLKGSFENLQTDTLYIRCDLGEVVPPVVFEVEREDYTTISFSVMESGKNGHVLARDYKFTMTFKGFLYHLCV